MKETSGSNQYSNNGNTKMNGEREVEMVFEENNGGKFCKWVEKDELDFGVQYSLVNIKTKILKLRYIAEKE